MVAYAFSRCAKSVSSITPAGGAAPVELGGWDESSARKLPRSRSEIPLTAEHLGHIAVTQRMHAQNNPNAAMHGKPMTMDDYLNSRMICEPLRLFDCCQEDDGGCALLITSPERARDMNQPAAIVIAGWLSCHVQTLTMSGCSLASNSS